MLDKIILLIVANTGYHPVEYGYTRQILEEAGCTVKVTSQANNIAYSKPSEAHSQKCTDPNCNNVILEYPQFANVKIDTPLAMVNVDEYDGIFIIGGPGALEFLDNQATYSLMQKFATTGEPWGAICISPRILAKAGLLADKKATGWNGDNQLETIFSEYGVVYSKEPVVLDGNIITADGPTSATSFGNAIVSYFKNDQRS
jgi:protease I